LIAGLRISSIFAAGKWHKLTAFICKSSKFLPKNIKNMDIKRRGSSNYGFSISE
jgi:hypothetical protein